MIYRVCLLGWIMLVAGRVCGQDSIQFKQYFYANGQVSSEGYLFKGQPSGYWKTYHENGQLKSEGNRKNFELDSVWVFYNDTGGRQMEIAYKKGKKNGSRISYINGEKIEEQYVNDLKQGYTRYYYPNGKIKKMIPFVAGQAYGVGKEFSPDSLIITLFEYKKGFITNREYINRYDSQKRKHGKWKLFYENGNIYREESYLHGIKNGFFKTYSENGSLVKIEKYVDGVLQHEPKELQRLDVKTDYYPNGNKKIVGSYKNEIPQGIRRYFSVDGRVDSAKVYENGHVIGEGIVDTEGLKQGRWREYYTAMNVGGARQLKAEGTYLNGYKTGKWTYYYRNGTIEQTGNYNEQGQETGEWNWFFSNGELQRKESFRKGLAEGRMVEYSDSLTDKNGNRRVIAKGDYIDGLEEGFWLYDYGDIRDEGSYVSGRRNGLWKQYYDNEKLSFQGQYLDDVPDGKHLYFWDNGNLYKEGVYAAGRPHGEWKWYNRDGTIFMTIFYRFGQEIKYNGVRIKPALTN